MAIKATILIMISMHTQGKGNLRRYLFLIIPNCKPTEEIHLLKTEHWDK